MNDVCSVMSVPLEPNRLVIELLSRKRGVTALLTSPFNSKVGCSLNKIKKIASLKQPLFLLNGEVIWQAGDSSLTKELHKLLCRGGRSSDVLPVQIIASYTYRENTPVHADTCAK